MCFLSLNRASSRLLFTVLGVWIAASTLNAFGHVADTSLLRILVLKDRLQLEFNVDLQTLQALSPVDLDQNGEVDIAEFEKNRPTYERLFQKQLRLSLKDQAEAGWIPIKAEWQSPSSRIPSNDLRNAHVQFTLEHLFAHGEPSPFHFQPQVFEALGANHRIILGVVEGETSEQAVLTVTEPAIEYVPRGARNAKGAASPSSEAPNTTQPARSGALQLIILGIEHILSGFDHLLFLLTLLLAAPGWRPMLWCVSAFTAAHSLTLALAALGWVQLPDQWVESAIAASIAWVAFRNLRTQEKPPDWKQTFLFGLVHGFGFATLFRELRLPQGQFLQGVLAFNLGVEAGQIAILIPLVPVLLAIRGRPWSAPIRKAVSLAALIVALIWLFERMRAPIRLPE